MSDILCDIAWHLDRFTNGVFAERQRQVEKWGDQRLPDGTGSYNHKRLAEIYRRGCDDAAAKGEVTWRDVFLEEAWEAVAESRPDRLREELIQCAAVIAAWVYDIDRREKK